MVFDNWSRDGERAHAVIYSIDAGPVVDPRVEDLWPLPAEFGVTRLRAWSEEELRSQLTGDALRDNLILNKWEFATGKTVLQSYPWRLSVPFVLCNAQCEFCAAWSIKGNIRLDDLIASLIPVIRHCYQLDLVRFFARSASSTTPRKRERRLMKSLAFGACRPISIHAATSATHQDLMGFGPADFDRVVAAVGKLIARKREFPNIGVELVLVVTQQNLAEIPAFIAMAEYLGADQVNLRTLMPRLDAEIPLVALLGLMHLGIARLLGVLGRGRRRDDPRFREDRIDNRAGGERRPGHHPLHRAQKHRPPRRPRLAFKPHRRQAQLLHAPTLACLPPNTHYTIAAGRWLLQSVPRCSGCTYQARRALPACGC